MQLPPANVIYSVHVMQKKNASHARVQLQVFANGILVKIRARTLDNSQLCYNLTGMSLLISVPIILKYVRLLHKIQLSLNLLWTPLVAYTINQIKFLQTTSVSISCYSAKK